MDREVLEQKLCELPVVQYEFFETSELLFTVLLSGDTNERRRI